MSLEPLTNAGELKAAFNSLRRNLTRDCQRMERFIGWQGGGKNFLVHWNPRLAMWTVLDRAKNGKRYLCFFGFQDPTRFRKLTIVCEVNPPSRRYDRRTAGVFARDGAGRLYLAHSGKIGGGRPGIGKGSFIAAYGGEQMEPIVWPDRKQTEVFVIGRMDSPRLPVQVRDFVSQVKEFKDAAALQEKNRKSPRLKLILKPEFEGPRKSYRIERTIEGRCDHGPVVNTLRKVLRERLGRVERDRERDLYVLSAKGQITHLFEAKTDTSTSSIYGAVGQLMLHGAATSPPPRRILVVPGSPKKQTRRALTNLGIRVLTYYWKGDQPQFENLAEVLR